MSTSKSMATCLPLLALAAAVLAFNASPASAQRPPVTLTPNHFDITAYPGERVSLKTEFHNGTDVPLSLHVTSEDFWPGGEEGGVALGRTEDPSFSLKSWVRPSVADQSVGPGETLPIEVAIDIPPSAQAGSRWGALLVTTGPTPGNEGALVRTLITATLLLRVGGETSEEMIVESFSVSEVSETTPLIFTTRFRNTGQVHLKPQGTITVHNLLGNPVASVTLPGENVLPGTTRKMEAKWGEGLGFGRYTARLEATYGRPQKPLSAETHFWVLPWNENGPVLSVFLASLAIGMFVIWKRKNVRAAFRKDQEDREEKGGKILGRSGD